MLVNRSARIRWDGPFNFIPKDEWTVYEQLDRERKMFWSSCVEPWETQMKADSTIPIDKHIGVESNKGYSAETNRKKGTEEQNGMCAQKQVHNSRPKM